MQSKTEILLIFMMLAICTTALVFGLRLSETGDVSVPQIDQKTFLHQLPPNATVLPSPGPILFDLYVSCHGITISKEESLTLPLTIVSRGEVNLSLVIGGGDVPEAAILPLGINAVFDQTMLLVNADSTTVVNVTISVEAEVESGIYMLGITAIERNSLWTVGSGVPIELTVP